MQYYECSRSFQRIYCDILYLICCKENLFRRFIGARLRSKICYAGIMDTMTVLV